MAKLSQPRTDTRDRLIIALYAELKAERQTRVALEEAIRNGVVSADVLSAIVADPVPVITSDDVAAVETALERETRRGHRSAKIPGELT